MTIRYFTTDQAVNLSGLSRRRLRYWHEHGFFAPEHLAGAGAFKWLYSFADIVALRSIAKLLGRGVGLAELRRVAECLSEHQGRWREITFRVSGKKVSWLDPETGQWEGAHPPGQIEFDLAMDEVEEEAAGVVELLGTRPASEIGHISRRRNIAANAFVVSGTRVPVSAIRAFHDEGYSPESILMQYPHLNLEDVQAAIDWKEERRAS